MGPVRFAPPVERRWKVSGQQVEAFLRAPRAPVVLVYGPDQGVVRERVERLIGGVLADPKDPFRLSELTADAVRALGVQTEPRRVRHHEGLSLPVRYRV